MQTQVTVRGYVVGPIWWPAGVEYFKEFTYDLTRESQRKEGADFRSHIVDIVCDGDFQSASIACGEIEISYRRKNGDRVTRTIPLECFPSIADCLHSDPDWCPQYGEDE